MKGRKGLILDQIIEHFNFKNKTAFAKFLGKKPNAIINWFYRDTYDAELLAEKFPELNPAWILTAGEVGEMLRVDEKRKNKEIKKLQNEIEEINIIKDYIKKSGKKRGEIAEEIGVSEKTLYNYEEDISKIKHGEIKKLATVFEVTPLEFFTEYRTKKEVDLKEIRKELKQNNKTTNDLMKKLNKSLAVMEKFQKIITKFHENSASLKDEDVKEHLDAISTVMSLVSLDIDSLNDLQKEQLSLYRKVRKI